MTRQNTCPVTHSSFMSINKHFDDILKSLEPRRLGSDKKKKTNSRSTPINPFPPGAITIHHEPHSQPSKAKQLNPPSRILQRIGTDADPCHVTTYSDASTTYLSTNLSTKARVYINKHRGRSCARWFPSLLNAYGCRLA